MILTLSVSVPKDCEFEQEVHADGKVFVPAGSGPCLKCRCKVSVWSITCRKCWILEGTEKSQQKDTNKSGLFFFFKGNISHMHWWLFIFMETTCLTLMQSISDFSHWSSWLVLRQIYTDIWEGISNTPTHLLVVSQTAPWCKFKRSLIWSVLCLASASQKAKNSMHSCYLK